MHLNRQLLTATAIVGGLAVLIGAFGAHGLDLPDGPRSTFETASRYHLIHAVALGVIAALGSRGPSWFGWSMIAGIVLFSGSLYWLALGGPRWLGPVTPVGGVLLVVAWSSLAFARPVGESE